MKTIEDFHGAFAVQLRMFLIEKRALGFKYHEEERVLHIFNDFSEGFDCSDGLSRELVLAFTKKQPQWSPGTHGHFISILRQFAGFLKGHGIAAYMCEPQRKKTTYDKFKPYIFTEGQIALLFEKADSIEPSKSSPLMHVFYPVLFRVLYGCGLRISEALKLRVKDVDLAEGILYINDPKNHRDRIAPMEASLMRYVAYYAKIANTLAGDKDYFFRTPKGGMFCHRGIYSRFRMLLWQCGISHGGRSHGPRIHDLRHSFAVHSLRQLERNGINYQASLPVISAYLGHASIAATNGYLRLTAECFPEITNKTEKCFGHVIPVSEEVVDNETY